MRKVYSPECQDPPFDPAPREIAGVDLAIQVERHTGKITIVGGREISDIPNTVRVNNTVYTLELVKQTGKATDLIWYAALYA